MIELADDWWDAHPVANMLMAVGIVLVIALLVVFARPLTRALLSLDLWFMRARGVADPEPEEEPPGPGLLWVDDRPDDNHRLRGDLERKGVPIDVVRSTSEALAALEERHYALVLSDLSRVEDGKNVPDAGLRLLAQMAPETPVVIYSKFESLPTAYRDRALEEGAVAVVSSVDEVWEWLRAVDLLP